MCRDLQELNNFFQLVPVLHFYNIYQPEFSGLLVQFHHGVFLMFGHHFSYFFLSYGGREGEGQFLKPAEGAQYLILGTTAWTQQKIVACLQFSAKSSVCN